MPPRRVAPRLSSDLASALRPTARAPAAPDAPAPTPTQYVGTCTVGLGRATSDPTLSARQQAARQESGVYKRMIILLRSLCCMLPLLPAHRRAPPARPRLACPASPRRRDTTPPSLQDQPRGGVTGPGLLPCVLPRAGEGRRIRRGPGRVSSAPGRVADARAGLLVSPLAAASGLDHGGLPVPTRRDAVGRRVCGPPVRAGHAPGPPSHR